MGSITPILIGVDFEPVPAAFEPPLVDELHAAASKPAAPKTTSKRSFFDPFTCTPVRTTEAPDPILGRARVAMMPDLQGHRSWSGHRCQRRQPFTARRIAAKDQPGLSPMHPQSKNAKRPR